MVYLEETAVIRAEINSFCTLFMQSKELKGFSVTFNLYRDVHPPAAHPQHYWGVTLLGLSLRPAPRCLPLILIHCRKYPLRHLVQITLDHWSTPAAPSMGCKDASPPLWCWSHCMLPEISHTKAPSLIVPTGAVQNRTRLRGWLPIGPQWGSCLASVLLKRVLQLGCWRLSLHRNSPTSGGKYASCAR